jgi:hypothetical protein
MVRKRLLKSLTGSQTDLPLTAIEPVATLRFWQRSSWMIDLSRHRLDRWLRSAILRLHVEALVLAIPVLASVLPIRRLLEALTPSRVPASTSLAHAANALSAPRACGLSLDASGGDFRGTALCRLSLRPHAELGSLLGRVAWRLLDSRARAAMRRDSDLPGEVIASAEASHLSNKVCWQIRETPWVISRGTVADDQSSHTTFTD